MKKKLILQKITIRNFVIVFLIALIAFSAVRVGAHNFANKAVFHGTTDNGGDAPKTDTAVSLLKDMTPIAVDEGSSFYELFQTQQRVNVLCLGVNEGMTDTIMLISYDMENQKIDIISVPRDTYYFRGKGFISYAHHKINAIYSSQGVVRLAEVVSEILYGMPIHYYAIVEYNDVKAVMQVIGGVEMNIPFHMKYDDTTRGHELHVDIPAGIQTIDAGNVMEFLRFRKGSPGYSGYPDGDIQRQSVQQEFVKKVLKKCLSAGNLSQVSKTALENVESDMTYGMAAKIALRAMSGLSGDSINSYMLPGYPDTIQELSFWVPYESEIQAMLDGIYKPAPEEPAEQPAAPVAQTGGQ